MEQTPNVTPEMYAELMGQQDPQTQPPQQMQQPDPSQMQQGQPQPQMQQPEQQPQPEPAPEDIEQAKKILGVDGMQQQLEQLVAQNVRETVSKKYPDVPFELVEKEIEKVAAIDPNFAKAMKTTPDGLEMAYRSAMASYKPQEKPDNLTEGEGGSGQNDNPIEEAVMKGEADDVGLGDYILSIQ